MGYNWDYLNKEGYNNNTGHYRSKIELDFIGKNIQNKKYKILDIAGGSGRISIPLLKYADNITVTDINADALRILDERKLGIRTVAGDFEKTEFKDKFSLVLCIEGPDYFHDWNNLFQKISSLLEKDGKFIFTYTNPDSWRYSARKLKQAGKADPYYSPNFIQLKELLERFNFEFEDIKGFNWTLFPVRSNSIFVHLFTFLEKILMLGKWHSQSPWLIISVKKRN
ncbi:MAG TPA: class I SAM-dependent methyltransferase [Bacteroidia bacterium]|jgi:SAM-dependent methyltransferase|nr:class I SAM-dependent methyltransferase [Bacteroidia bacterium]HRG52942.1 class I SAM-dependent methyltransferase [Bacteroidia bacterium]